MSMNIKNPETHRLAQELSKLTGESMTGAITNALKERILRLRRRRGTDLSERLVKIGNDCAARLKEPYRSMEHGDLLYDEKGLPR